MQTMMHEQSGLPSYDERIPLLSDEKDAELSSRLSKLRENALTDLFDTSKITDARVNPLSEEDKEEQTIRVKKLMKARYPNVDFSKLVIRYSRKNPMDIVVKGPRGGEIKIALADGSGLQKCFIEKTFVKNSLGPPAEDLIEKQNQTSKKDKKN